MIVPVTFGNQDEWVKLCLALWPDSTPSELIHERIEGRFRNEFLYLKEGVPVGFISLAVRRDYVEGAQTNPVGYVEGIYVRPECRRQGIAKELVEFAKQWTKDHGLTEIASDCERDNEASRVFHERMGFSEVNSIICYAMRL